MVRQGARSQPLGRGLAVTFACLVAPFLFPACGSNRGPEDAAPSQVDTMVPYLDGPVFIEPNLDAKAGQGGGSLCDASAQCLSGACTLGQCSDWAHAMRIDIDTTRSGTDIPEAVSQFPLLVRLNATNFPFHQARRDGADIRFLDAMANTLDYQIESWDQDGEAADLWVLVPRIEGNTRDNAIFLYWGNPLSTPVSSGPAVFGDDAFVFHMGIDANRITTQLADASGHDNTGTVQSQSGGDLRGEGISGAGLALDGNSIVTTTAKPTAPQPMTLSIWLKTTSRSGGGIAGFDSKPRSNDGLQDRSIAMNRDGTISFSMLRQGARATLTSLARYNDGVWHLIAARFSQSGQYLFIDGEAVADDPTMNQADNYLGYWRLGEEPGPPVQSGNSDAGVASSNYISANLDEASVNTRELSDAWIKLAYATQRPGATALVFSAQN